MRLITAIIDVWKRPFDYKGVTTRKNYWFYFLSTIIISVLIGVLQKFFDTLGYVFIDSYVSYFFLVISKTFKIIDVLFDIGLLVINPSIIIRRLRDAGKQWQWFFLCLVPIIGWIWLIVLLCQPTKRN